MNLTRSKPMSASASRSLHAPVIAIAFFTGAPLVVHAQTTAPATTGPSESVALFRENVSPPDPEKLRNAISGGLEWLAKQQITSGPEAGSWVGGTSPTAVTSLVGLSLMAHGTQPHAGRYGKNLDAAMEYIKQSMTPEGYVGTRGTSMYSHALCTLFAISYLGQSADPEKEVELAKWCRRAIDVIIQAQRIRKSPAEQGGWRYAPDSNESDVSVTTWQLLALQAARQCGYDIDQPVFDDAMRYLNSAAREPRGAVGFLYRPGVSKDPEPDVTGAAVAVKILLETPADARLPRTEKFLDLYPPAWGGRQYQGFFYSFSFYMVQGYFQLGTRSWSRYGPAAQRIIVEHQSGDGRWAFPIDGEQENRASGPAYAAAMSLLILGIDNQYLPMFQRQAEIFGETR